MQYYVTGVYPGGIVSRHHVTTDNIASYVHSTLTGLLPFVAAGAVPCENPFSCDHGSKP